MGLVRSLQPWDILLMYCNNQFKKYITPLLRLASRVLSTPPHSYVYVRSFFCPFLYFNKTLLMNKGLLKFKKKKKKKSSWVIKPGPWSQS